MTEPADAPSSAKSRASSANLEKARQAYRRTALERATQVVQMSQDGWSDEEIATSLGLAPGSGRNLVRRSRHRVAENDPA